VERCAVGCGREVKKNRIAHNHLFIYTETKHLKYFQMSAHKTHHIVIDGGPCSGKTTGMSVVKQRLEQIGKRVVVVPEAATLYINSGFNKSNIDLVDFQVAIFQLQLQNEEFWNDQAKNLAGDSDIVFLYDRGLLTGSAYIEDLNTKTNISLFENVVIRPSKLDGLEDVRSRYGGVLHMVTAAIGAEHAYTTENNSARLETPEQARLLDLKTQSAWLGHGHLRVIDNEAEDGGSKSFHQKLHDLVSSVFEILGYPQPVEDEDKYVLHNFNIENIPVPYEVIQIEQVYLESLVEERIRTRKGKLSNSYYHTIKKPNPNGAGRIEIERLVSHRVAEDLLLKGNKKLFPIQKKRVCFLYEGQYFEVDIFEGVLAGLVMCEREKSSHSMETNVPDFLGPYESVTDNPKYKNKSLSSLKSLSQLV